MKKQKPLILNISQPCTENWTEMTPVGLGRFCSHCQKTVTDITGMTDAAIVQLFEKQSDTHCIRAFASQLNRTIIFSPQAPTRFYRIAVALGLTILGFTAVNTYARPRPPLSEQHYLFDTDDGTNKEMIGGDTLKIRGVVLDETNNPFPGVVVKLMKGGLIKGGAITEDDGSFEINEIENNFDDYHIVISTVGYSSKKITLSKNNFNLVFKIKMDVDDIHVMGDFIITKPLLEPSGRKTYNTKELKNFGL